MAASSKPDWTRAPTPMMPICSRSPGASGGAAKTTGARATTAAAAVPAALRARNSRRLSFFMSGPPCLDYPELPRRPAGGAQVVEAQLRILARQDHAVRAGLESGLDGLMDVVRLRLLLVRSRRDVDIDAGPDLQPGRGPRHRARGLAAHVVGAEPFLGDAIERLLVRVLLHAIHEPQRFLGGEVGEERRADVADVARQTRAAPASIPCPRAASRQCGQKQAAVLGRAPSPWLAPSASLSGPCRSLPHMSPSSSPYERR